VQEREAKEKEKRKKVRDAGGDISSSSSSESSSDEDAMRGGVPEYKEKVRRMFLTAETSSADLFSSSSALLSPSPSTLVARCMILTLLFPRPSQGGTKGDGKGVSQFKARMRYYASPRVVMDRALRNTINNNTQVDISFPLIALCSQRLTFLIRGHTDGSSSAT